MSGLTMEDWLKEIQDEKLKKVQQATVPKEEKPKETKTEDKPFTKLTKEDLL